jgi:hypothetical protein
MKKLIITALLVVFGLSLFSQDDGFYGSSDTDKDKSEKIKQHRTFEKWSFGGNFWLSIGSSSYIELSPVAMYRATPRLMIGPGFTYIYSSFNNYASNFSTSTYGPKAIAQFALFTNLKESINLNIGNIILQSEYEYLNIDKLYYDNNGMIFSDGRVWINNFLIGGGIFQPLGKKGGISIIILFNVIESEYAIYENPVFRFGFYF